MKAQVAYNNRMHEIEVEEIGPAIYVYKNVLSQDMRIVERVEKALAIPGTRFNWQPSMTGRQTISDHRTCMDWKLHPKTLEPKDKFSNDALDLHDEIIDKLKLCLEHYKPNNYVAEISYFEAINVVRYGSGQYFKTHTDDGDTYRCTLSAVGYPNDNYEGGELKFPKFNLTYKPVAGDFVLFPSSYAYAHSSEPVTDDGVKYSLVIMTDRNSFANRKDSPVLYDPELLRNNGFKVHGM